MVCEWELVGECLKAQILIILFADDTNLLLSHHDIETLNRTMNAQPKEVALWLTAQK